MMFILVNCQFVLEIYGALVCVCVCVCVCALLLLLLCNSLLPNTYTCTTTLYIHVYTVHVMYSSIELVTKHLALGCLLIVSGLNH